MELIRSASMPSSPAALSVRKADSSSPSSQPLRVRCRQTRCAIVSASAVLSSLLVTTGLLGILRLLSAGSVVTAEALVAVGLLTATSGAVVGIAQQRLKRY
jgi:hypothetical protein